MMLADTGSKQLITPAAILRVSFLGADCMLMIYLLDYAHLECLHFENYGSIKVFLFNINKLQSSCTSLMSYCRSITLRCRLPHRLFVNYKFSTRPHLPLTGVPLSIKSLPFAICICNL
jgi:hypothetical protein